MGRQVQQGPERLNPNAPPPRPATFSTPGRSRRQKIFLSLLARFFGRNPEKSGAGIGNPSSILLFKPDGIGDCILWNRVFRQFAERYRDSVITVLCCAPVGELIFSMFPGWKVVEMPKRPASLSSFFRMLAYYPRLRNIEPHDLLVDLRAHRGLWELLYSALLRASRKIGVAKPRPVSGQADLGESRFFDFLVIGDQCRNPESETHECAELDLVDQFSSSIWGLGSQDQSPDLRDFSWGPFPERRWGTYWVLAPFSGGPIRDYPLDKWAEVFHQLISLGRKPDRLLICGAQSQFGRAQALGHGLRGMLPVENLCGWLSLPETAGCLAQAELVFATESAVAHLAVALRRPTVVVLGGGHFGLFAPWGRRIAPVRWIWNPIPCYGCNWNCPYPKNLCISEISPREIVQSAQELLSPPPS